MFINWYEVWNYDLSKRQQLFSSRNPKDLSILATLLYTCALFRCLYVSLLWPCLLHTLGYLSSFFLAERKLRWPSLPLLLSPPHSATHLPASCNRIPLPLWATYTAPRSQLVVIRPAGRTQSGPLTAFLFRRLLTTLCQLHRLCKGFGQWQTEDR